MTIYDLIVLSFILCIMAIAINHTNTSRYARAAAKKHCAQHGLQFLDQNVVLKGLRLRRSQQQLLAVERRYHFEFSSVGDYRYNGKVVLISKRVKHIELDTYKTQNNIDAS